MSTFILTFLLFLLVIGGMAVGVIFGRAPIAGSCGGLNNPEGNCSCANPCSRRRKAMASRQQDEQAIEFKRTL